MFKKVFEFLKGLFRDNFEGEKLDMRGIVRIIVGMCMKDGVLKALEMAKVLFSSENEDVIKEKAAKLAVEKLNIGEKLGGMLGELLYESAIWAIEKLESKIEENNGK